MEKKFQADSRENELEVIIEFSCRSDDDGSELDSIVVFDGDEDVTGLITKEEMARIESEAQSLADDNASEAYQDYIEGAADRAYDAWKDDQMERGE